jgi:hypothetical protein
MQYLNSVYSNFTYGWKKNGVEVFNLILMENMDAEKGFFSAEKSSFRAGSRLFEGESRLFFWKGISVLLKGYPNWGRNRMYNTQYTVADILYIMQTIQSRTLKNKYVYLSNKNIDLLHSPTPPLSPPPLGYKKIWFSILFLLKMVRQKCEDKSYLICSFLHK